MREVAQEFEPSYETIREWVRQANRDEGLDLSGPTTDEKEELRRLRRENRHLRLEREILARAAAYPAGDRLGTTEACEFVSDRQARYPVATMCRVLEISTSGCYAWLGRWPSRRAREDVELGERIEMIHAQSRGTYGPRIHAELKAEGLWVGRKRVARLMREAGLTGVSRRRKTKTTQRDPEAQAAPDLVEREFTSDSGRQYAAVAFGKRGREAGIRPSMGSVGGGGACYDNALCESFFATLECELLDRVTLRNHAEARRALFGYIEGWYNVH